MPIKRKKGARRASSVSEASFEGVYQKYRNNLKSFREKRLLDKYKDQLLAMMKAAPAEAGKAEEVMESHFKWLLNPDLEMNHLDAQGLPQSINPLLQLIERLERALRRQMKSLKEQRNEVSEELDDIQAAASGILDFALNELKTGVDKLLPENLRNINLTEYIDACANVVRSATALISTCKSMALLSSRTSFDSWLNHALDEYQAVGNEIQRYVKRKVEFVGAEGSVAEPGEFRKIISDIETKLKEIGDELGQLSMNKFRKRMEEHLATVPEFHQLDEHNQHGVLLELERRHLMRLHERLGSDIVARTAVLQWEDKKKGELAIDAVQARLGEKHSIVKKLMTENLVPTDDQIKRDIAIKKQLSHDIAVKRKKLIARGLLLAGVGFALAGLIASSFLVPGLALTLLLAGSLVCLMLAKVVGKGASIDDITKKGFMYFFDKIRGKTDHTKVMKGHQSMMPLGGYMDASKRIRQKKVDRIFKKRDEYPRAVGRQVDRFRASKGKSIEEEIYSDANKMIRKQGVTDPDRAVKDAIEKKRNSATQSIVPDTNEIAQVKQLKPVVTMVDRLKAVEHFASQSYDALDESGMSAAVGDALSMTSDVINNPDVQAAAKIYDTVALAKLAKMAYHITNMSLAVTAACAKSVYAGKMLDFDYWVKRRLVDRFNIQAELKLSNEFCDNKPLDRRAQELIDSIKVFDKLLSAVKRSGEKSVSSDEMGRRLNQLSLKQFRKHLQQVLLEEDAFLGLTEAQQIAAIGYLERQHLENRLEQIQGDLLARAKVEVPANDREQFAKHLEDKYLKYEGGGVDSFKKDFLDAIKSAPASRNESDVRCNDQIKNELKWDLKEKRAKIASRAFLLIFAGLAMAALVASIVIGVAALVSVTIAVPGLIPGLLVGALAAAVIAKAIKKDESLENIVKKGMGNLFSKVQKQFTLWHAKETMQKDREEVAPELPVGGPSLSGAKNNGA